MKRAVVLGGGGAKGSYEIGVWRALRELNVDYSIVTGSSVGALNGAMMAQGGYEDAERMWMYLTTEDVLRISEKKAAAAIPEPIRASKSLSRVMDGFLKTAVEHLDPSPLERIVREKVDEARVRSGVQFGISATEYPSMRPAELTMEEIPEGLLADYLMASSAFYPAMDAREVGGSRYIDGGYNDNVPVALALDMGADEVVAVDMQAVGIVRPVKSDVPVRTVRCRWNLGPLMVFDPQNAVRNMALGWNDAMKSYGVYEGSAYTFINGTYASHSSRFGALFADMLPRVMREQTLRLYAQSRGISSRLFERRIVTAAAEAAGEVFGVTPTQVWEATAFDEAVCAAEKRETTPLELVENVLSSSMQLEDMAAAVGKMAEGGALARYMAGRVGDIASSGARAADLRVAANMLAREFLAGLYLYALGHAAG